MNAVAEIEYVLRQLPVEDARAVANRLQEDLDEKRHKRIDDDIDSGRLDKVAEKAIAD